MRPKISVLMSTYNRGREINKAIKSIINQTYSNFEFIICDDGSTDNTLMYLEMWARRDKRIKILINKKNKGLQVSLNKCIKHSRGEYIARMDDDDISLPFRFQMQLNFLRNHPNISFVGSNVILFDSKYGIYGRNKFIRYPDKWQLFKRDEFNHPSIMIRSAIIKSVHGYSLNKKFYRIEDHELWLRLYSLGYLGANIQRPLIKYNADIHKKKNKFYDYYNRFRLLLNYRNKLNIGIKGYFYIILPLLKLLIPSYIRNKIYFYKYSKMVK